MTLPSIHEFIKCFFYNLGISYFQKLYTNLTLAPNVFKPNREA
jgi:hypothetical protein